MGTVKWYNATKGFGFIIMDSGGREIFVHATVLDRSSIAGLREGQRVFVEVRLSNWPSNPRGRSLGVTNRQRVSLTTRAAAAAATRLTTSVLIASGQRSSGRLNSGLLRRAPVLSGKNAILLAQVTRRMSA
jgi:cold shock CspA family protein